MTAMHRGVGGAGRAVGRGGVGGGLGAVGNGQTKQTYSIGISQITAVFVVCFPEKATNIHTLQEPGKQKYIVYESFSSLLYLCACFPEKATNFHTYTVNGNQTKQTTKPRKKMKTLNNRYIEGRVIVLLHKKWP